MTRQPEGGREGGKRANEIKNEETWRQGAFKNTTVFMQAQKKMQKEMGEERREDRKMRMEWEGIQKQWEKIEAQKGSGASEINSLWGLQDRGSGVQMLHYKHSVGYGHNTSHQFALDVQWKISTLLPLQAFPHELSCCWVNCRYTQQSRRLTRLAVWVFHAILFPPAKADCTGKKKALPFSHTVVFSYWVHSMLVQNVLWSKGG